jgi:hypothetical protein
VFSIVPLVISFFVPNAAKATAKAEPVIVD